MSSRVSLLENRSIVPLRLGLADEAVARGADAELAPVLLEQTKVGGVVGLGVAIGVVASIHILTVVDRQYYKVVSHDGNLTSRA